jgi:hypothetical protein
MDEKTILLYWVERVMSMRFLLLMMMLFGSLHGAVMLPVPGDSRVNRFDREHTAFGGLSHEKLKIHMAQKAAWHLKRAVDNVDEAKRTFSYLPRFEKKEYVYGLIAGSVGITTGDFRQKLITACQVMASTIFIDYYSEYCEIRSLLMSAEYHYEMSDFYNNAVNTIPFSQSYENGRDWLFWNGLKLLTHLETSCRFYAPCDTKEKLLVSIAKFKTAVLNSYDLDFNKRKSIKVHIDEFEKEIPKILCEILHDEIFEETVFEYFGLCVREFKDYQGWLRK